jgi:hypothetical protein
MNRNRQRALVNRLIYHPVKVSSDPRRLKQSFTKLERDP